MYLLYELIKSTLEARIEFIKRKINEFLDYEKLRA
mgnify:CR=1 FL=1